MFTVLIDCCDYRFTEVLRTVASSERGSRAGGAHTTTSAGAAAGALSAEGCSLAPVNFSKTSKGVKTMTDTHTHTHTCGHSHILTYMHIDMRTDGEIEID